MQPKSDKISRKYLRFGVAIPARNESDTIETCLSSLASFHQSGDAICVVNAHSTDNTAEIARQSGVSVIDADRPSRGAAVRCGANWLISQNKAIDVLLIAHADMIFQANSRERLNECLAQNPDIAWGALGHKIDGAGFIYRWLENGNAFRLRKWSLAYGDQAMFIRISALEQIGGFPHVDHLEDVELSLKLRRLAPACNLNCPVMIPTRHWRRGVIFTTARNWLTVLAYRLRRTILRGNH